jgi:hypothetical protein
VRSSWTLQRFSSPSFPCLSSFSFFELPRVCVRVFLEGGNRQCRKRPIFPLSLPPPMREGRCKVRLDGQRRARPTSLTVLPSKEHKVERSTAHLNRCGQPIPPLHALLLFRKKSLYTSADTIRGEKRKTNAGRHQHLSRLLPSLRFCLYRVTQEGPLADVCFFFYACVYMCVRRVVYHLQEGHKERQALWKEIRFY